MTNSRGWVEVREHIARLRSAMVDRLLAGLAVVGAVGAPISALRAWQTGWMAIYAVHLAIGAAVILVFIFRRRLSLAVRLSVVAALFWVVGLGGLLSFGLVGAGVWWMATCVLLIGVLYGLRAAVLAAVPMVVAIIVVGALFVRGILRVPFDLDAYMASTTAWATLVVGVAMMPSFVFAAVSVLQENMLTLLREGEQQRLQILDLSLRDELTGLPRARLARDRLDQALAVARRAQAKVAVLYIDLDGFKAVNDRRGHAAGDAVLRAVGERICAVIREQDTAARLGGDEFLVVLVAPTSEDEAQHVARRIRDAIRHEIAAEEGPLQVDASVGVAMFPGDGSDSESLIQRADAAMYIVKSRARSGERSSNS